MRKENPVESERKFAPNQSGHWKPHYIPKAVARAVLKGDDNAVGNSATLEASVEFDEGSCAVVIISIATDAVVTAETRRADGRRARCGHGVESFLRDEDSAPPPKPRPRIKLMECVAGLNRDFTNHPSN